MYNNKNLFWKGFLFDLKNAVLQFCWTFLENTRNVLEGFWDPLKVNIQICSYRLENPQNQYFPQK